MPAPLPTTIETAADLAATKARSVRDLPRYLFLSALAGAYVGIAVVLLVSVSAPMFAAGSSATKLVQAGVFGVALVLVVFAGAELFTGNAMVMLQGLRARTVRPLDVAAVWVASLSGNVVGSLAFAAAVHGGGTLDAGPGAGLVAAMVDGKVAATGGQLFWRAVLCNMLVCLALWMASRADSDIARAMVLWWGLLAFIGSGFEHSIANVTLFGLAIFQGSANVGDLARNLLYTVPGNVVGGGLLVGVGYSWLAGLRPAASPTPEVPSSPEPEISPSPEGADALHPDRVAAPAPVMVSGSVTTPGHIATSVPS